MKEYSDNWSEIAKEVKDRNHWKCERCGHFHDPLNGYTMTVHHAIPDTFLNEKWNLMCLCQRCHLAMQDRINFDTLYLLAYENWLSPHIRGYRRWKARQKRRLLFIKFFFPLYCYLQKIKEWLFYEKKI